MGRYLYRYHATAQIFADSDVISRQIDIDTELVTPTGAAIIAELAESYGAMPAMSVKKIGYGAGKKDVKIPNVLRVSMENFQKRKIQSLPRYWKQILMTRQAKLWDILWKGCLMQGQKMYSILPYL